MNKPNRGSKLAIHTFKYQVSQKNVHLCQGNSKNISSLICVLIYIVVNKNYYVVREGLNKQKKLCKITHLGGWVAQEWDKFHKKKQKKHSSKIYFRPF